MKIELEGVIDLETSDGGMSMWAQIDQYPEAEEGFFVRLLSWDSFRDHVPLADKQGRKVRITVEFES